MFLAALFPQFINAEAPIPMLILILGSTYIVVDGLFLATYGKGASWIESVSGTGLILTAVLPGLRSNSQNKQMKRKQFPAPDTNGVMCPSTRLHSSGIAKGAHNNRFETPLRYTTAATIIGRLVNSAVAGAVG